MKIYCHVLCLTSQDIFASGRVCFVPSYDSSSMAMEMYRVHSMDDIKSLPKTRWNIQQPSGMTTHTTSVFVSWKRNGSLTVFFIFQLMKGERRHSHQVGWTSLSLRD